MDRLLLEALKFEAKSVVIGKAKKVGLELNEKLILW